VLAHDHAGAADEGCRDVARPQRCTGLESDDNFILAGAADEDAGGGGGEAGLGDEACGDAFCGVELPGPGRKRIPADGADEKVGTPVRPAATAWLEPLPPGPVTKRPTVVSPGAGKRSQKKVRSCTKLPTTTT
jgi:hypothetical protein